MPRPPQPLHFRLTLTGLNSMFYVRSFSGHEVPDQPYAFDLVLLSEQADLDLTALLHEPAFLAINVDGAGIHGHVYDIAKVATTEYGTVYTLTLVPRLAYLEHRTNQRIFQQLTVRQIIARLLQEHDIARHDVEFRLKKPSHTRSYCVQYHETDLHFVQRLCEEEGIGYHFEHSLHGHRLVFEDSRDMCAKHSQPRIAGIQIAHVIGHEQGATRCDRQGWVKVRFHWHHTGLRDDHHCCWLPVAAGAELPRAGLDVLVTFIDGNPDRPVISGYLPTALGASSVEFHTVSRRRSTPDGTVLNELHRVPLSDPGKDDHPGGHRLRAG